MESACQWGKKYQKKMKNTQKHKKLIFLFFFEQNALKLCVLKSEMCVIPMLNVGISKQMSINQDHIKASLRGREAILWALFAIPISSSWAKMVI